jgi:hypothetical protein
MMEEKMLEIRMTELSHPALVIMPIPLMMTKIAAIINRMPASERTLDSCKKAEKNQDFPVQPMSGWNSTTW